MGEAGRGPALLLAIAGTAEISVGPLARSSFVPRRNFIHFEGLPKACFQAIFAGACCRTPEACSGGARGRVGKMSVV